MSNNNMNDQKINEMLKKAAANLGTTPDELKRKLQSGSVSDIKGAERLNAVLGDKQAMNKLMNSPAVKQMLESLKKNGGNSKQD